MKLAEPIRQGGCSIQALQHHRHEQLLGKDSGAIQLWCTAAPEQLYTHSRFGIIFSCLLLLLLLLQVERDLQLIDELGLNLVQTPNTHCHAGGWVLSANLGYLTVDSRQESLCVQLLQAWIELAFARRCAAALAARLCSNALCSHVYYSQLHAQQASGTYY